MITRFITKDDIDLMTTFYHESINESNLLLEPMTKQILESKFFSIEPHCFRSHIGIFDEEKLIGLTSYSINLEKRNAYLTLLMIKTGYQRKCNGTVLLNMVLEDLKDKQIEKIETVFFNPVQLPFYVSNKKEIHPNMPGVLVGSPYESLLLKQGFHVYAKQNVYYKDLNTPNIHNLELIYQKLKDNQIVVGYYHELEIKDHEALFKNLNNPGFEHAFKTAISKNELMLVAVKNHEVIGFTGPLKVISSRGSFAGIGVSSLYRGYGIGKILFHELCVRLKDLGATYMTLFTGEENPARRIYEAEGFQIVHSFHNLRKTI